MNEQDWAKVLAVFESAIALSDGQEIARLIENELADEPHLADRVRELLSHDLAASTFRQSAAPTLAKYVIDHLDEGTLVGRYRILRQIGEGGMGAVYLAQRADHVFEKTVALKLIRGDLSEVAFERFRIERQALAQLEHQNIARLLDGGVDNHNRPYVAMEYVDGCSITSYCNDQQLNITKRLLLFCDLCDAVQHAHRNLVVHRDIKPSNVMVSLDGKVKLLDFGIAKLLGPAGTATTLGMRAMTPDYASPEQVTGRPISTATDVYQLGALLFELLSGRKAVDSSSMSLRQFEEAVTSGELPTPSQAFSKLPEAQSASIAKGRGCTIARLRDRLVGDLDTITSKAMAVDPALRYGSPGRLAEDIRRHFEGLPIQARVASPHYKLAKFLKRNVVPVSIAASAASAIILFSGYLYVQSERLARERDVARMEQQRSSAMVEFLVDAMSVSNPEKMPNLNTSADVLNLAKAGKLNDVLPSTSSNREHVLQIIELYHRTYPNTSARELLKTLWGARGNYGEKYDDAAFGLLLARTLIREKAWDELSTIGSDLYKIRDRITPNQRAELALVSAYVASRRRDGDAEPLFEEALSQAVISQGSRSQLALRALLGLLEFHGSKGEEAALKASLGRIEARYADASASDFPYRLIEQARMDIDAGTNYRQAEERLVSALEYSNMQPQAYLELARLEMKTKGLTLNGLQRAEDLIRRAQSLDPSFADTYVLLLYVLTHQRRYEEAGAALSKAEQLGASSEWMSYNKGQWLSRMGRFDEALIELDKASHLQALGPDGRAGALDEMADIYVKLDKLKEAKESRRMAVALNSGSSCTLGGYAKFLRKEFLDLEESEKWARRGLGADYRCPSSNTALGLTLYLKWAELASSSSPQADEILLEAREYVAKPGELLSEVAYYRRFHPIIDFLPTLGYEPTQPWVVQRAIKNGRVETVIALIARGADPNGRDEDHTHLMLASSLGDKAVVDHLLTAGAAPDLIDSSGFSAADHALAAGFPEIASKVEDAVAKSEGEEASIFGATCPFMIGHSYRVTQKFRSDGMEFSIGSKIIFAWEDDGGEASNTTCYFWTSDDREFLRDWKAPKAEVVKSAEYFEYLGLPARGRSPRAIRD
ncbi:MAG: hypothetical protein DHS20C11_21410 [Lysobacteraceae bacterium]|nr:MAG: hypothetical protein DHS20C11_21410 [Xanthomonadaceae bacterium]